MKKVIIPALAATLVAGLASCSSDQLAVDSGKYGVVSITAQLPSTISRAFADGTTATTLSYAVLDATSGKFVALDDQNTMVGTATFVNLETTVTVQLAKAKSYKFYFWADSGENSPYTFDYTNKQVTVNYDAAVGNMEAYDAFYGTAEVAVSGSLNQTVTLTRPFAQLNIGTSDLAAAERTGFEAKNVTVTVSGLNTLFSLEDGKATGEPTGTVTFATAALPDGQSFPVDGYQYLSMNYILVGHEKTTTDVTMTVDNGAGVSTPTATYATVPVQQNYRTNIYGALLTDPANFTVKIDPNFNTPDNDRLAGSIPVNSATELANAIANAKAGDIVALESSIDISASPLTVDKDVTIYIPAGSTLTTSTAVGYFLDNDIYYGVHVAEGATLTLSGTGTIAGNKNPLVVDGNLIVDGITITTTRTDSGTAIYVYPGGSVTYNANIQSANLGIENYGSAVVNGGTILSNSYKLGGYAIRSTGNITINGGYIEGAKGALGIGDEDPYPGGTAVINGGEFVVPAATDDDHYAYYALAVGNANVEINGGYFWSANATFYKLDSGAKISLKGGWYNNNAKLGANTDLSGFVADGYSWNEINSTYNGRDYQYGVAAAQ